MRSGSYTCVITIGLTLFAGLLGRAYGTSELAKTILPVC